MTEISTDEVSQADSLENSTIPTENPLFQQNLFHLIVLMMKALQACCSKEELKSSYEYITQVLDSQHLLDLHEHTTKTQSESDFLSFLSYFDYAVIDSIRPVYLKIRIYHIILWQSFSLPVSPIYRIISLSSCSWYINGILEIKSLRLLFNKFNKC